MNRILLILILIAVSYLIFKPEPQDNTYYLTMIDGLWGNNAELIAENQQLKDEIKNTKYVGCYKQFKDEDDLRYWLSQNKVNEQIYSKEHDCDDFMIDLVEAGLSESYFIGLVLNMGHAYNFTIIGNDIWYIEPQTDEIFIGSVVD